MSEKIITFIESDNDLIKQDFKEFNQAKLFGESENVKVVPSRNEAYVFMVKHDKETYFFGLKGETLDAMASAIDDLAKKAGKAAKGE